MMKAHDLFARDRAMTDAAYAERWGEAHHADESPRRGERDLTRLSRGSGGQIVECSDQQVEQFRMRILVAEAQHQFGDGRRAHEAAELLGQRRPRTRNVEASQRLEIASRLDENLGRALREQIERRAESALRTPSTLGENGLDSRVARGHAKDSRRLEVVHGVQHDYLGDEKRHTRKLAVGAKTEKEDTARRAIAGDALIAGVRCIVHTHGEREAEHSSAIARRTTK